MPFTIDKQPVIFADLLRSLKLNMLVDPIYLEENKVIKVIYTESMSRDIPLISRLADSLLMVFCSLLYSHGFCLLNIVVRKLSPGNWTLII